MARDIVYKCDVCGKKLPETDKTFLQMSLVVMSPSANGVSQHLREYCSNECFRNDQDEYLDH